MLEKIRLALRIKHHLLDEDILDTIEQARSEMGRAGVSLDVAQSDLSIVEGAIKTFCLYKYAENQNLAEGYLRSWEYQLDNLRKSTMGLPYV